MRYLASGGLKGRLAKLAAIPLVGAIIAACTEQANDNPTGDNAAPNLFGQASDGSWGFPHEVVTAEGIASAGLYLPIFIIAVIIFIIVEGLLLYLILRYRKRSQGDDLPEQTHGNNMLEIVWTAIPMVVVFVLFVVSTNVLMNDVEAKADDHGAVVDVQAFRFGWIFDYKDPASLDPEAGEYQPLGVPTISGGGREGAPEMTLPVGEPVLIRLTAADVIHSWYVPSFFFKRDAIPGRVNEFEITIEQEGVYGGQCAEFCGLAHGDMFFSVNAVSPDEYDAWVAEQSGASGGVDPGADAETEEAGEAEAGTVTDPAEISEDAEAPQDLPPARDEAGGAQLEIATTAEKSIGYTTTSLEAKAGQPVTVTYTNDAEIPHNIAFYDGPDAESTQIVVSETITGPGATTTVSFTAPTEPGEYFFRCELHPLQMVGTLTVTP